LIGLLILLSSCLSPKSTEHSTTPISNTTLIETSVLTQTTTSLTPTTPGEELDMHFLNVGEGDSILLDYGTTDVLIDGGEESSNVANLIKPYVHGDLEAVIATHYHADHIGGLINVFKDYHVDNAFWNGEVDTTQTYLNWKSAMDSSGATEQIVKRGDVIQEGTLTFNVLDPVITTDSDPDQDCIVLSLQYGSESFLFMADDGQPAEDNLLAAGLLHHYDILKVGHHGSDTASSPEFLNVVKPEIAIYECGINNDYGFPKADVITRLQQDGATVYGTDTSGTVEIITNGGSQNVRTEEGTQSTVATSITTSASTTGTTTTTSSTLSSLQVISVTSPVARGASATLIAKTVPGAQCTITVNYASGPSTASGLTPKIADSSGNVSWTWNIGVKTTPGTWKIVVTSTSQGSTTTTTTNFTVN
jgi:beta-lactamase superfamily II metal-dependent hydrolase